ncbi:DUF1028 domain-containing protein [Fibrobacterota bacterium]
MIRKVLFLAFLLCPFIASGQHTFSIVAVDTVTGQVGSAGASCIDINNSYHINRINEIVPGKGAINAQANWDFTNLANAKQRMELGDSPEEIIEWLKDNDSQNKPQRMQYGIADIDNDRPRATAFTGTSAMDWKGHKVGHNYATQGNILIGKHVVDSIESKFLQATGSLPERLMAALQGANFAGADQRCLDEGVSSRSSFIRVALPTDTDGKYWLDLGVGETPYGVEPIDELQKKFDVWNDTATHIFENIQKKTFEAFILHNKKCGIITFEFSNATPDKLELITFSGKVIHNQSISKLQTAKLDLNTFSNGFYFVNFYKNGIRIGTRKISLIQ